MRWIRHLTTAQDDPAMQELLDEFGPAGYGVFWLMVETIGRTIGPENQDPIVRKSLTRWASSCRVRAPFMSKIVAKLDELKLIDAEIDPPYIDVRIDNILKYCDEYAQKIRRKSGSESGQTPERVAVEGKVRSKGI